jgi:hypothetical protein
VGSARFTKSALNYWAQAVFGGDYVEVTKEVEPTPLGLVSEPPKTGACVKRLEYEMWSALSGSAKPTAAQLYEKCRRLNKLVERQALELMIRWQSSLGIAASQGIHVTDAEVKQRYEVVRSGRFPSVLDTRKYFRYRRWSLGVELLMLKLELITEKLQRVAGSQAGAQTSLAVSPAEEKRWIAKTTCQAGYVVEGCKEYKPSTDVGPSIAVLSLEIMDLKNGPGGAPPSLSPE